jgi:hypothetical protein
MKLVLLKLLDSGIETRDRLKHLIMLLFVPITLTLRLCHFLFLARHQLIKGINLLLVFI